MFNLFGEAVDQPKEKTFKEKYQDYIASPQWKRLRDAKIKSVGGVCERCGISKWSERLEVHHLHYRTFKKESLSDLQALCHKCHTYADMERQTLSDLEKKARQQSSSLYIGFTQWMKNGRDYDKEITSNKIWQAKISFLTMLYRNQGKKYSIDLGVFGYSDPNPSWKPGE